MRVPGSLGPGSQPVNELELEEVDFWWLIRHTLSQAGGGSLSREDKVSQTTFTLSLPISISIGIILGPMEPAADVRDLTPPKNRRVGVIIYGHGG